MIILSEKGKRYLEDEGVNVQKFVQDSDEEEWNKLVDYIINTETHYDIQQLERSKKFMTLNGLYEHLAIDSV